MNAAITTISRFLIDFILLCLMNIQIYLSPLLKNKNNLFPSSLLRPQITVTHQVISLGNREGITVGNHK